MIAYLDSSVLLRLVLRQQDALGEWDQVEPMPTTLGTLDAIHLATALLWRDAAAVDLVMATHDGSLARAARSFGLTVVGC